LNRELEQFESLVSELSAAMARVPADAVDNEVDTWLGKICLALDLDRSAVYQRTTAEGPVYISHTWNRPNLNIPIVPRSLDVGRYFRKTTEWVLAGNPFVYASRSEVPPDFRVPDRIAERYSAKSAVVMPMWAGDRVIGAASFARFRSARDWSPRLLERLTLAARIFGSAIERKQAAAESQASRAELVLAQRRSMMGEMVASLAHELNQPLGAILNNLGGLGRLLAQGNREPALAARAISNAIEDTKRAGEIVRRVRAMFSGASTNKVAIDIAALVSEVATLIGSESALRKITVEIERPASPLEVLGDRVLLQQCVLNLLVNAFDALMDTPELERRVTVGIAPEKPGWIALSVGDNGSGIDRSVAGRVFEPFVTTKSGGMGLGLLVTQSIVEDHGGKIWLMPNAERGTTFTFTLPVMEKTNAPRKVARKNTGERKARDR
jgi:C4-dicarboxylate-specific signal transduction histidine kinase